MVDGSQIQLVERKISYSYREFNLQFISYPSHSLISTLTTLKPVIGMFVYM